MLPYAYYYSKVNLGLRNLIAILLFAFISHTVHNKLLHWSKRKNASKLLKENVAISVF